MKEKRSDHEFRLLLAVKGRGLFLATNKKKESFDGFLSALRRKHPFDKFVVENQGVDIKTSRPGTMVVDSWDWCPGASVWLILPDETIQILNDPPSPDAVMWEGPCPSCGTILPFVVEQRPAAAYARPLSECPECGKEKAVIAENLQRLSGFRRSLLPGEIDAFRVKKEYLQRDDCEVFWENRLEIPFVPVVLMHGPKF